MELRSEETIASLALKSTSVPRNTVGFEAVVRASVWKTAKVPGWGLGGNNHVPGWGLGGNGYVSCDDYAGFTSLCTFSSTPLYHHY